MDPRNFYLLGRLRRKTTMFLLGIVLVFVIGGGLLTAGVVSSLTAILSDQNQEDYTYDGVDGDVTNLTPMVLQWQSAVEKEMKKQKLDIKWLPALLGIIQVESGGDATRTPDIFQASESKSLPKNSLNTQQSIQAGVAALKASIEQAKANGIDDPLAILYGYNVGSGVFSYMKKQGIKKWNINFAEKYSRNVVFPAVTGKPASDAKPEKYENEISAIDGKPYTIPNGGNFHYPNLVLYALGGAEAVRLGYLPTTLGSSGGSGDVIKIARSVLGYWSYSQPNRTSVLAQINSPKREGYTDCSGFTYWVYKKAGMRVPDVMWWTGSMQEDIFGAQHYLKHISEGQTKAGDLVVDHKGDGYEHTAILLEKWHGNETKIIQMGGSFTNHSINISTYGWSFHSEPTAFARGIRAKK